MDVFVIPVGADSYELYYEQQAEDVEPGDESPSSGLIARMQRRVAEWLRAAEKHADGASERPDTPTSWTGRLQDRALTWAAKRIAEQRLLWNLRAQKRVVAVHPGDMSFEEVRQHVDRVLRRDYERHRRWIVIDGILFLVTSVVLGPLFLLVPGVANLPALYFGFRTVGHWFSARGADRGRHVEWAGRPSDELMELRRVLSGPWRERHERLQQISSALHLRDLPAFVERVTAKKTG